MALALPSEGADENTPEKALELLLCAYESGNEAYSKKSISKGYYPTGIYDDHDKGPEIDDAPSSSGNLSPESPEEKSRSKMEDLFEIAFTYLHDALGESRINQGHLSSSSELVVKRVLTLLSMAIVKNRGSDYSMHATKGCMQYMRVKVTTRKMIVYKNQTTNTSVNRLERGSESSIVIRTHPLHSIHKLRKMIAAAERFAEPSRLTFDGQSKNLNDVDQRSLLSDMGLHEGSEVSAYYSTTPSYTGTTFHNNTASSTHQNRVLDAYPYSSDQKSFDEKIGDNQDAINVQALLSGDDARFSCLLDLCDIVQDEAILQKLWLLISMTPTQTLVTSAYETMIDECAVELAKVSDSSSAAVQLPNIDWRAFVFGGQSDGSASRTCYMLQTLDYMLQPAKEASNKDAQAQADRFKQLFLQSGGFKTVLDIVLSKAPTASKSTEAGQDVSPYIQRIASATSLHILHFLLFHGLDIDVDHMTHVIPTSRILEDGSNSADMDLSELGLKEYAEAVTRAAERAVSDKRAYTTDMIATSNERERILSEMKQNPLELAELVRKLEKMTIAATMNQQYVEVKTFLDILTLLLNLDVVPPMLIEGDQAKTLLVVPLRNELESVRSLCSRFIICVGQKQPQIFQWLVEEVRGVEPGDTACGEIFEAVAALLADGSSDSSTPGDVQALAVFLSGRVLDCRESSLGDFELLGILKILRILVVHHHNVIAQTKLGSCLESTLLSEFLFTVPTSMVHSSGLSGGAEKEVDKPLCHTPTLRRTAFDVLQAWQAGSEGDCRDQMSERIADLLKQANLLKHSGKSDDWYLVAAPYDSNKHESDEVVFAGLKNQGCTCYANSTLQQLFMCKRLRRAILEAPMLEHHRATTWHLSDAELVGRTLMIDTRNQMVCYKVVDYNEAKRQHTLYGPVNEHGKDLGNAKNIPFGSMRRYREEGRVRLVGVGDSSDKEYATLSQKDRDALTILDQLQRTFAYLEFSRKRYYDPRPLIEACKPLNMEFSVFHQNDATEFFDKLMEFVEEGTKGTHTGINVWKDRIAAHVFGGTFLWEKLQNLSSKWECGHEQELRKQTFNAVQLQSRGQESVFTGLDMCFEAEFIGGENAIKCSVCEKPADCVRRHSIETLPDTLIIHLKRFDIDYNTFETVKLNNRIEFPMSIDMFPGQKRAWTLCRKIQRGRGRREKTPLKVSIWEQITEKVTTMRILLLIGQSLRICALTQS